LEVLGCLGQFQHASKTIIDIGKWLDLFPVEN